MPESIVEMSICLESESVGFFEFLFLFLFLLLLFVFLALDTVTDLISFLEK